ncbi:YdcF family protein [Corynebacterium sanguinis]|uniref:YdcF family protein n=1 Tax=Corynebacterium sanguinis TaxID=2594913 RepID=UPI00223B56EF|nr:YdcF family protein [Corynebacterium sanguinis]MDN8622239.1 YdcF family protein [Corynebacterium sanguinis]
MAKGPIVVLGARVIDGRPSRMLEARLAAALSLYRSDPSRPLLVSGFEEAGAMAAWLVARGVPGAAIALEPAARSTNENLENSRAMFPSAPRLTVVTNGFHVLRTKVWAWHLGIPVDIVAAETPASSRSRNYAREVVALPHSVARVAWRRLARRLLGR